MPFPKCTVGARCGCGAWRIRPGNCATRATGCEGYIPACLMETSERCPHQYYPVDAACGPDCDDYIAADSLHAALLEAAGDED